ncbi:acyl carrier protein [Tritonibacter multivorans]|uniref:Acyl carrier protein n=1 Tax=Tritonibacter multivorans TaxID=928856 RepID=A0A0P1FZI5_9RHOB|nr:DUF6005 family protein [Tritonibacter multivorans]MDA7422482.1 DUF6005 family protein [Tritonibacter multivorans]CUH74858.1 acyl carrier protein [Tritonibacter multivorans]SFD42705.1 hypothetical protein SAMN04488049_11323 [Tritonibacter multivorans]
MTFDSILTAIESTLRGPLQNTHMQHFSAHALLNDQLHLDSVLIINLLLHLETDHGIDVPEREFSKDAFKTVADLIHSILGSEAEKPIGVTTASPSPEGAEITVHCVVSCICAAIRRQEGVDFRPFYFGTWDSDFALTPDMRLSYHSPEMSHAHFFQWATKLYGLQIRSWYDHSQNKSANLIHFETCLAQKHPSEDLMVLVDMYHLPERENKFNQNPFPHFVLIEGTADPDSWHMNDADYRWRGDLPRAAILNAMAQPTVAGGYVLRWDQVAPPKPADVAEYFNKTLLADHNPLTSAVRDIVTHHASPERLPAMQDALRELPVLSLRKYAFEHAFAFFWEELDTPFADFDAECDRIEALCEGYRQFHYQAARAAHTQDQTLIPEVLQALDRLDRLEYDIKAALTAQFDQWCALKLAPKTETQGELA